MSWFRRAKTPRAPLPERKLQVPEGLWRKCESCKEVLYAKAIQQNGQACPRCDFHFAISIDERLALLMDPDSVEELETGLFSVDPLKFKDQQAYKDRLRRYVDSTGREDAVVVVRGSVMGHGLIACLMDFSFLGGSLGSVVGEKITRAAERALAERLPLLIVSQSGGARMQEGVLSLMQMAKVNAALGRLDDAGLPYLSLLTHPTTGGVTASYAMVGDVIMAEPGALIGFAGPRVIEQTIKQTLPEGFQRSEFLLEHGMLDMVVPRRELRQVVARCLSFFTGQPSRAVAGEREREQALPGLGDGRAPVTGSPDEASGAGPYATH